MAPLYTIVHSKLDYCNSIFPKLESAQLNCLQLIQNSPTTAVTRTPKHHHLTSGGSRGAIPPWLLPIQFCHGLFPLQQREKTFLVLIFPIYVIILLRK